MPSEPTPSRAAPWALLLALASALASGDTRAGPLAERLQPHVDRGELAGAVALVANREGVVAVETVGDADLASRRPMAADTLFWIASQTKPMTAVAVMMLVDEGRIALDDPVGKYLPEFRDQKVVAEETPDRLVLRQPARPLTLRDTLSHVGGMPFQSALETPTLDGLPLAVAVRSYAMTPLLADPGTAYRYSNAGINTAARVLEVVSGKPYAEFMEERLFAPLGMRDTTFWPDETRTARLATSYRPNEDKTGLVGTPISQLGHPLSDRRGRYAMPAGGLFSTAADTALFCRMMLRRGEWNGTRLLSESSWRELTRRQTPETLKDSYGLGFAVGPDGFGHGGAHATSMEIRPADGLVLVWMVQQTGGFPGAGATCLAEFKREALARFGRR